MKNPTPENKHQIAQLVGFSVQEIVNQRTDFLDRIADVKRVGYGEKAMFDVGLGGVRAFIQAKGATTARTKVASKTIALDTIAVSARPFVNIIEMQTGRRQMSDLIADAATKMENAQMKHIGAVLSAGLARSTADNYYASGNGIVAATLDPMVQHFSRMGGVSLIGDIAMVSQLAGQTGFASSTTTTQFSDSLIEEYNRNGFIGTYKGASVIRLNNPIVDEDDTLAVTTKELYILPTGIDTSMRPLKVVFEGDIYSIEDTNTDDLSFEVRMDQYFNAAVVYGDRPYMGLYKDTTV